MWEHSFRDKTAERRLFRMRAIILGLFIFVMLCGLAWRMSYLQIELHEKYKNLSENNRVQLRPLAPNRGLIYDRNGVLLAENIPSYSLTIVAERVKDLDQTLTFLYDLIEVSERDREQFDKRLKLRRRPFEPVVLRYRLSEEEIAKEFWDIFLSRNQSIIVDLMYGQLKSTVTCLTCNKSFLSFDPYLMT